MQAYSQVVGALGADRAGRGATGHRSVLRVTGVDKWFEKDDRRITVIRDLHLSFTGGSFVAVVGRSGCGKSTLLNMLAGLSMPSGGSIEYRGSRIEGPSSDMGYLTQQDTLMPWRGGVRRNVELPLEVAGVPASERRRRADELIAQVSLSGFEDHYPWELSGGMRRRASLARMLCADPHTLLLDEPFGALDAQLRRELQEELLSLWTGTGKTVIFVTHDLDEAIFLADRVIVLGSGGEVVLDHDVAIERPRDLDEIRLQPAAATAVTNTGLFVGGVVGPTAFGLLVEHSSYPLAWTVAGAWMLTAAVLAMGSQRFEAG